MLLLSVVKSLHHWKPVQAELVPFEVIHRELQWPSKTRGAYGFPWITTRENTHSWVRNLAVHFLGRSNQHRRGSSLLLQITWLKEASSFAGRKGKRIFHQLSNPNCFSTHRKIQQHYYYHEKLCTKTQAFSSHKLSAKINAPTAATASLGDTGSWLATCCEHGIKSFSRKKLERKDSSLRVS